MQNLSYHAYNGLAYRIYMVSFQHGSGTAVGDSRGVIWSWWKDHDGWGRCAGVV